MGYVKIMTPVLLLSSSVFSVAFSVPSVRLKSPPKPSGLIVSPVLTALDADLGSSTVVAGASAGTAFGGASPELALSSAFALEASLFFGSTFLALLLLGGGAEMLLDDGRLRSSTIVDWFKRGCRFNMISAKRGYAFRVATKGINGLLIIGRGWKMTRSAHPRVRGCVTALLAVVPN